LRDRSRTTAASVLVALAHLADVMLRVEFEAKLGDKIELRLEKVDVVILSAGVCGRSFMVDVRPQG